MSNLFLKLPSFATDYSGFLSVMYGLGGLMVLHDPSGCMGNYTNCDEPRWYADPQPVFSSTLRELEAVTGETQTVITKVVEAASSLNASFICILSTPVPSLTGCDIDAIAEAVQEQTGIKTYGIPTTGFKFYNDGMKRALALLFSEFMAQTPKKEKTVNLLGMTPLDYFINGEDEKMRRIVEGKGWKVNCFVGMERDMDKLYEAPSAEKNIVMSMAALPLAKAMQEQFGIPYWIGPPCGESGKREMDAFLNGTDYEAKTCREKDNKVLIIGEQACANAIRRSLNVEQGYKNISVATFFEFQKTKAQAGDKVLKNEVELKKLILSEGFDTVIGDPIFRQLCPENVRFISISHPAVSSKLHWKEYVSILG